MSLGWLTVCHESTLSAIFAPLKTKCAQIDRKIYNSTRGFSEIIAYLCIRITTEEETTLPMTMRQTILLCALAAVTHAAAQRDTISLDDGWRFSRSEQMDAAQVVSLPHDFQIGQPWVTPATDEGRSTDDAAQTAGRLSARGFKEMGCGWYERTLDTDSLGLADRRVLLDFGGIMLVGDVWLNGEHIGKTDYGYLGFECDVTGRLKPGRNTLRVKADTRGAENSRWYTGGGLYRSVRLIATPRDRYFARHPLYITTRDNREVHIQAEIYAADSKATALTVRTRIRDAEGRVVAEQTSRPPYYRRQRLAEYRLEPVVLDDPHLWSPDTPYLYTAEVALMDAEGRVADCVTERFGVRTVEIGPDYGLRLNGTKTLLRGWAIHHTLGHLGAAAYPRAIEKRLRLMKQWGFNHVRTSHNPYSDDFYRLCDEIGILVVDELYDKWTTRYAGGRADWTALWQRDIPEWVRRDRNHPSVVVWSLGNELQQMSNLPFNDWGVTAYRLQRQLLHRYDSTRLTTVAMHPRYRDLATDSLPAPLARATDLQAYNYRYMYFPGDHRRYPYMTFYQSEANMTGLPANYYGMQLDRVVGLAYWGAISYFGESRGWPLKGWDDSFFDITLQPKPLAWLIRSMFRPEEPTVHIAVVDRKAGAQEWNGIRLGIDQTSDHWNRTEGQRLRIYTYTNADEVELLVGGRSMGTKPNRRDDACQRNVIVWDDVPYRAGRAEAVARTNGRVVARHRIETTGPAVRLSLEPDNADWRADGQDLQHVRITALDRQGRRVPTANGDVRLSLAGDARIVAVGNGDMCSSETADQQHIHLYQGSALVVLRAGSRPASIRLTAQAEGLKRAIIECKTK